MFPHRTEHRAISQGWANSWYKLKIYVKSTALAVQILAVSAPFLVSILRRNEKWTDALF